MAMAMAAAVAGVGAVRVTIASAVPAVRSTRGVSHLCSSFTGLSVRSWKKTQNAAELSLSVESSSAAVKRPVGFPVAKMKTHKAAAKRFRVTGSGKIVRRQARRAHLLSKKTTSRKNRLAGRVQVNRSDYDNVIGALPYLKVKRNV